MKVLPVITRELRAQARQPFTYWLRSLGVVALLCGAIFFLTERQHQNRTGSAPAPGAVFRALAEN